MLRSVFPGLSLTRRTFLASLSVTAAMIAVTGCAPEAQTENTPLTATQAERFATMRFALHQQGTFRANATVESDVPMTAEVQVDLSALAGYGSFTTTVGPEETQSGLLAWNADRLAVASPAELSKADAAEWFARAVETSVISDLFLLMLLSLGTDRPENPQLLQQSSARFHGTEKVDGVTCEIFSGPTDAADSGTSRTRYWVSEDGEMKRFAAHLDTTRSDWSRADILPADNDYAVPAQVSELLSAGGA